jgi:hypothetical protein
MASTPFIQQLYSKLPELQELNKNIGPVIIQANIDNIKARYSEQLSNCSSLEELLFKDPNIVFNYISVLENLIVSGNDANHSSNVASYVIQKISILESAYSNLSQSSTQSSQ